MAALVETIAVVDKSGKAISTSKHLIDIFNGAKTAYRDRKAQIAAGRRYEPEEKKASRTLKACTIDNDVCSTSSSRKHKSSRHPSHRFPSERQYTSSSLNGSGSPRSPRSPTSPRKLSHNLNGSSAASNQLVRRHTDRDGESSPPSTPSRTMTTPNLPLARREEDDIDMDLAYGPIPPPLPVTHVSDEAELKGLINKAKKLLEEADCLQHSASATIANLQKNPDAMAAVALTLAEISNIASKMAPGVLVAMKGSAPAVFALLASPQFLIAGGVAVGVTIVALGGYKVVKKIKAKNAARQENSMDEMLEIGGDVSRIDNWRRGIADVESQSVGTTVDGEIITPTAAALSGLNLAERGVESDVSKTTKTRRKRVEKEKGKKAEKSKDVSEGSEKSDKKRKEKKIKEKQPSSLRLMFR